MQIPVLGKPRSSAERGNFHHRFAVPKLYFPSHGSRDSVFLMNRFRTADAKMACRGFGPDCRMDIGLLGLNAIDLTAALLAPMQQGSRAGFGFPGAQDLRVQINGITMERIVLNFIGRLEYANAFLL